MIRYYNQCQNVKTLTEMARIKTIKLNYNDQFLIEKLKIR
jgi:hypothetical protein